MNQVCNNYDFQYSSRISSLIYTASNSKKFGFHIINVYYMIKSFDNRFVIDMNVSYGYSHIVLDTRIGNNECMRRIFQ